MASPAPSKLRSACNACNATKVRCSGEKTGCKRCIANGLTCKYEFSKVGRAPSRKRARLSPQSPQQNNILPVSPFTGSSQDSASIRRPSGQNEESLLTSDYTSSTNAVVQDQSPLQTHMGNCKCTPYGTKTSQNDHGDLATLPDLDLDFDIFTTDFNIDDFPELSNVDLTEPSAREPEPVPGHEQPLSSGPQRCPISMFSPPPEKASCENPHHDKFKHVLHMVKVVGTLEIKAAEDHLPLDEVLHVTRAAIKTVLMIFEAENRQPCKSCRALIPTAMDLVMNLYEKAISAETDKAPSAEASSEVAFCLGSYKLDVDDQAAFRDALIARELRRTCSTLQSLSQWMRCHSQGANCGMVRWFGRMESRLQEISPSGSLI